MPGLMAALGGIAHREFSIALRKPGDSLNPLVFFLMTSTLFPLAVGPDATTLQAIGPGVTWVAALLAMLLPLHSQFGADYEDGSLEQYLTSAQPLPLLVLGKVLSHWLVTAAPLVLVAPVVALTYRMPGAVVPVMMLSLVLGTLSLSLIGSVGAALTVGLARGHSLLSLLILPLAMPLLIFGARTAALAASGDPHTGGLLLLAAYLAGSLALAPFATAAALRISSE